MNFNLKPVLDSVSRISALALFLVTPVACKPQESADVSALGKSNVVAPSPTAEPKSKIDSVTDNNPTVIYKTLTAAEWVSKKDLSPEQEKTVKAILRGLSDFGGPSGDPLTAMRWAEQNLQSLSLDQLGLSDIYPLLALKKIVTLSLSGNNISQEQLDDLLAGLPNLKTLVKDKGLRCNKDKYPKLTCLE